MTAPDQRQMAARPTQPSVTEWTTAGTSAMSTTVSTTHSILSGGGGVSVAYWLEGGQFHCFFVYRLHLLQLYEFSVPNTSVPNFEGVIISWKISCLNEFTKQLLKWNAEFHFHPNFRVPNSIFFSYFFNVDVLNHLINDAKCIFFSLVDFNYNCFATGFLTHPQYSCFHDDGTTTYRSVNVAKGSLCDGVNDCGATQDLTRFRDELGCGFWILKLPKINISIVFKKRPFCIKFAKIFQKKQTHLGRTER